ncbi:MAG: Gfo/Idh/MocA family oxidoreductase [Planctomycetales bacterium]|nr:Gfo/Idh/MocA family oxidoreductase [Planctomycetales bacterium]
MAIGFGIVGCGMIAKFHAKAIRDISGAKLIGCQSRSLSKAQSFADEFGATAYESLDDMLANKDIDVVTVCTPSGAHLEPAIAAAEAGKHVIIEKPLEITLKRCDQIIAACEKNNVLLATIFPSRFHKSAQLMKKAVDAGRFGRLTMGDAYVKWYRTQEYYDSGAWRGTWKLDGGGALMNQAIHSVDLLAWLMGPAESITAHTTTLAHERIAVEDVAVATIRFENGALGVIEASTAAYPGYLKRIELHGTDGSAVLEEEDITKWDFRKVRKSDEALKAEMAGKTETGGGAADPAAIGHHGHLAQFKDFVNAVKKGTRPAIDGKEGRKAVEIILAIYKAAESGKTVSLPLPADPTLKARKKG